MLDGQQREQNRARDRGDPDHVDHVNTDAAEDCCGVAFAALRFGLDDVRFTAMAFL
jgi:hypothetical protein